RCEGHSRHGSRASLLRQRFQRNLERGRAPWRVRRLVRSSLIRTTQEAQQDTGKSTQRIDGIIRPCAVLSFLFSLCVSSSVSSVSLWFVFLRIEECLHASFPRTDASNVAVTNLVRFGR